MADIDRLKAEEKMIYEDEMRPLFSADETDEMKHRLSADEQPDPILRVEGEPEQNNNRYAWLLVGVLALLLLAGGAIPMVFNLWSLFILIPGLKQLRTVWATGTETREHRNALLSGSILTYISLTFLIGLGWGMFMPMILILLGWLHWSEQPRLNHRS